MIDLDNNTRGIESIRVSFGELVGTMVETDQRVAEHHPTPVRSVTLP